MNPRKKTSILICFARFNRAQY